MAQAVKVMVRCRPMNRKEIDRGCISSIQVDIPNNQIHLLKQQNKEPPKSFSFDFVFAPDSPQNLIYEQSAFSLVDNVLDGYNGTIFAYGQTGCGKTHTMMGTNQNEQSKGIIPRTFSQIITVTKNDLSKTHLIRCSFIEIYNEQIHDLLSKDCKEKKELKESPEKGVFVKDLLQIQVDSISKMEEYMQIGFKNRAVRATNMNAESSRSHSIFTIYIDSQQNDQKGNQKYKASKLNLVDLAGSQRASKTGATGDGMKQATKINLSLSALGNVISALVDGKINHIPYRDSKLTRLLQDSLGGNTKTIMIAAISPANYNYDQTLSTLRYASRAKFIKNKPKINEDPKDALLREYTDEIKKLRLMLEGKVPMDLTSLSKIQTTDQQDYSSQKSITKQGENKQNDLLQKQLKNKQNELRSQQQQKKLLKQKLQNLQKHFSHNIPNNTDKSQLQKMKKLKQKLKLQKKKQQQYLKDKQKRQQQLLNIEKNYKSLNEQVDEMKIRFNEIKNKYVNNLVELKDLQHQHETQKEELLDTIRIQEKEIKKFSSILNMIMSQDQIDYIVNNSQWNEERTQWNIPHFTYKQKNMGLPKLTNTISMSRRSSYDYDKEKKEVVMKTVSKQLSEKDKDKCGDLGFKVNGIVKNARQAHMIPNNSNPNIKVLNMANRAQLTPLKIDAYQKGKSQKLFDPASNQRNKMIQKLNPIKDR